jgi:hypothetical protein
MNLNHNYIGPDELIYNNDGEIHSGGFSVNSIMLKNGLSPIITLNESIITGGGNENKVSDLFNNLVVPNWSLSYNYKSGGSSNIINNKNQENDDDTLEDSLHDKLLNLVKVDKNEVLNSRSQNKKQSKKNVKQFKINKNTGTKKNIKINNK